jgi:serine/threonine-protein kinase
LLLREHGEEIPLMPKAFDTLDYLVAHSGKVVEKDELMSAVWQDRIVEENNLAQNISALRRALGEKHRENRFIATIPGRGYKFVAKVQQLPSQEIIRSLAVLPFKAITASSRDEALEMGMADTLILKLGGEHLKVPPIAAVRRFASPEQDPADAGRHLGAQTVLDGGIQIVAGRIRVSARLIRVSDGRQMWAGQFDEQLRDIFSIQDSISDKVSAALRISLRNGNQNRKTYTTNVHAYQLYMKGNLHARRLTRADVAKGISYYEQAIAADPNYALAYVELANAYRAMVLTNDAKPAETMPKAKAAAKRAMELDDTLAEAWTALGISDFWYDWDWQASEMHYMKALQLDPYSGLVHAFYAHLLSNTGRHEDAVAEIKRARELDPLNLVTNAMEGQILFFAGRTDEAEKVLRATMDMDPDFWLTHLFMTRIYLKKEMFAEALESAAKAKQLTGGNGESIGTLGYAAAKFGKRHRAHRALKELEARAGKGFVPAYAIAQIQLALGDRTKAMNLLEKAFEQREPLMVFIKVEPKWDALRSEPRFLQIMKRMKFDSTGTSDQCRTSE